MKKNSTGITKLIRSLIVLFPGSKANETNKANSAIDKDSPVLVAGKANAVGAVYKFPVATPGLEALITITGLNNDKPAIGNETQLNEQTYNTQTLVKPVDVKQDEESWVSFTIDFKDAEEVAVVKKSIFRLTLNNIFYNLI